MKYVSKKKGKKVNLNLREKLLLESKESGYNNQI